MASCGYTPDQIDAMAWFDVAALFTLWGRTPPTHEAVRRIGEGLGIEKPLPLPEVSVDEIRNRPPPKGFLSIDELEVAHNLPGSIAHSLARDFPGGHQAFVEALARERQVQQVKNG